MPYPSHGVLGTASLGPAWKPPHPHSGEHQRKPRHTGHRKALSSRCVYWMEIFSTLISFPSHLTIIGGSVTDFGLQLPFP